MKKIKKQNRQNRVLFVSRKNMRICHILFFAGLSAVLAGLFLPGRLHILALILLFCGILSMLFGLYARDYFFRCPSCGQSLFKKYSVWKRMRGICPENCRKCHWHTVIEYTK